MVFVTAECVLLDLFLISFGLANTKFFLSMMDSSPPADGAIFLVILETRARIKFVSIAKISATSHVIVLLLLCVVFSKKTVISGLIADTPGCLLLFMALERMKLPVFRIDFDDNESFTSLKTQDSLRWAQDSDLSDDDDDVITNENLPLVAAAVLPSSARLPEWI